MKLIGLTIARNEGWCIRASLTAALRWCDSVIALDHCSTDATALIIAQVAEAHPGRVTLLREEDPVWHEMRYRQRTLDVARELGATAVAIIDADEVLSENLVPTIREYIEALRPGEVLQPPWITCWRSLDAYRSDPGCPFSSAAVSMAIMDSPEVRWQIHDGDYDFHMRHAGQAAWIKPWRDFERGGLMHFQHANWRRLLSKQLLYQMIETDRYGYIRANYAGTVNEAGLQTTPIPEDWWGPERAMIDLEAEPWQVEECRRRIRENGVGKYRNCSLLSGAMEAGLIE